MICMIHYVSTCVFIHVYLSAILGLKDEGDENEMKDMSILPSYGMLSEREKKVLCFILISCGDIVLEFI